MKEKQDTTPTKGEEPKTYVQIVAEVVKDITKHSTFLASMGESSASRQKTTSHERMRELEERLATQELAVRSAADRFQEELNARITAQQQEIEQLKTKQQEEIAALKKEQEEKTASMKKNLHALDGTISFVLRQMHSNSNNSMSQAPLGGSKNSMSQPYGGLLRRETLVVSYYFVMCGTLPVCFYVVCDTFLNG